MYCIQNQMYWDTCDVIFQFLQLIDPPIEHPDRIVASVQVLKYLSHDFTLNKKQNWEVLKRGK